MLNIPVWRLNLNDANKPLRLKTIKSFKHYHLFWIVRRKEGVLSIVPMIQSPKNVPFFHDLNTEL